MAETDIRYEHVTCRHCGKRYQLIDFTGNPHIWLLPGSLPAGERYHPVEGGIPKREFFPAAARG